MRPPMKLTAEEFDSLLAPEDDAPDTERRPALAASWAERMNDVPELCSNR